MVDELSGFDAFQPYYDIMVNWDARLARESPFLQRAFGSVHARRVLDCACGTGHHACLFARWNLETCASDISPLMVQKTTHLAGIMNVQLDVRQASFDQLSRVFDHPFDAAVCVGNSLSAAKSRSVVAAAIREMHQCLRPDGALILQLLNYDIFTPGQNVYGEPQAREHLGQNYLFLKCWRRAGSTCDMDIVLLQSGPGEGWTRTVFRERLLVLDRHTLAEMVEQAGFGNTKFYGGYDMTPFDPKQSRDLIIVARRLS